MKKTFLEWIKLLEKQKETNHYVKSIVDYMRENNIKEMPFPPINYNEFPANALIERMNMEARTKL